MAARDAAEELELRIVIVRTLDSHQYRVPSFPGVCVHLRRMKYQAANERNDGIAVYDGFIRDGVEVERSYPAVAIVDLSPHTSWFIEVKQ